MDETIWRIAAARLVENLINDPNIGKVFDDAYCPPEQLKDDFADILQETIGDLRVGQQQKRVSFDVSDTGTLNLIRNGDGLTISLWIQDAEDPSFDVWFCSADLEKK